MVQRESEHEFPSNTKIQPKIIMKNSKYENHETRVDRACECMDRGDFVRAQRLLRQVLAASPANSLALNSLAVLYCLTGRHRQANETLRHILEIHPGNLNAYFNLASFLHYNLQQTEESLAVLEELFACADHNSPQATSLFDSAFVLCREVQGSLAAKNHLAACQAVAELRTETETLTGHPVAVVFEDLPPASEAFTELTLHNGQNQHLIHCNRSYPNTVQQHSIAHELMRLHLMAQAQHAGKSKDFRMTGSSLQSLFGHFGPQMNQLRSRGWSEEAIQREVSQGVHSLLSALWHCPLALIIETKLRRQIPALSAAQFLAGWTLLEQVPPVNQILDAPSIMPRNLISAGLALNDVRSRLQDNLFGGTTAFASNYFDTEVFPLGTKLWERWQAFDFLPAPGDEYRLVDEFAETLGLRQGYEWRDHLDNSGDVQ